MMQCVFEAYGKNGFFHLEKIQRGIQPDVNAYSDSAAKKGSKHLTQHPFETKRKHYFQQMQVVYRFDTNIY